MQSTSYSPTRYIDPTKNRVTVSFTIEGEPLAKSGHYRNPNDLFGQQSVAMHYEGARGPGKPAEGGFGVKAEFYVGSRQRRDLDNFLKFIFDGLTGAAWLDDSQVTEVAAKTIHGSDNPRTVVTVYPTDDLPDWLSRECEHCGERFRTYASWSGKKYCKAECRRAAINLRRHRVCKDCGVSFQSERTVHERPFCSKECKYNNQRALVKCTECGTDFMWARSKAERYENAFCAPKCSSEFWRKQRKSQARGTCSDCGGHTSKRTYERCRACAFEFRRKNAKGAA